MVALETVKKMLYDDIDGFFIRIRDDYFDALTDEVMTTLVDFARTINEDVKTGKADPERFAILIDVLTTVHSVSVSTDNEIKSRYNDFFDTLTFELIKGI